MSAHKDIIIIGAGLVGLTAALSCAHKGASVILVDAEDPAAHLNKDYDGRASAIAASSFQMYRNLGVDVRLEGQVQPITDILIADGEAGKAPSPLSVHFDSEASGDGQPMGYMIENRHLRATLLNAIADRGDIEIIAPAKLRSFEETSASVQVSLDNGETLNANILIAADGRNSATRKLADIGVTGVPYKQKAIVTTVSFEQSHNGVAHELFLPSGPFAILPLTNKRANIVWSDKPSAVDAAMALPDDMFLSELSRRFGDMYGKLSLAAPRWAYPLSLQMAEDYVEGRVALIGDAAHAIHPIAGQGLNMGLRDAAALADIIHEQKSHGLDLAAGLGDYAVWRNFDNRVLAGSTDIFNRLFSTNFAPVKHARRLGMGLLDKISPAKSFFVQEAAGQNGELPSLLR